jgi:hypothetical protein
MNFVTFCDKYRGSPCFAKLLLFYLKMPQKLKIEILKLPATVKKSHLINHTS